MLFSFPFPSTMLILVPFLSPSFRLTGEGKTTCPRELTVVVYTSDLPAVFLLILSSYSYVRRFAPSFFMAVLTQQFRFRPPHCPRPCRVLASPR